MILAALSRPWMRPTITVGGGDIGTADIFTADYSSLDGNWDTQKGADGRTQSRIAAGGPKSLDAIEIAQTPDYAPGQTYSGHEKYLSPVGNGVARYYRWFEWHASGNNYRAYDGGDFIYKRLLIGFGTGSDDRVIINTDGTRDGLPHFEGIFDTMIASPLTSAGFSLNTWMAMQIEVIFGPSGGASLKMWINSDFYASPTLSVTGESHVEAESGFFQFGNYFNDGLAASGQYTFRHAAFRVATTFDSSWYGWMSS